MKKSPNAIGELRAARTETLENADGTILSVLNRESQIEVYLRNP